YILLFFFSSRRRHTRSKRDWSSYVCSSDLGMFLFILSTPIILVTIVMKNYVPTIIFTVVITLINVMGGNSEHRALFPWAAAGDIANNTLPLTYPPEYSYIA